MQLQHRHTFASAHKRVLVPYDYYQFGQRYIRGLVDFDTSQLGHEERFQTVQEQLDRGQGGFVYLDEVTDFVVESTTKGRYL